MSAQRRRPRSVAWLRFFSVITLIIPLIGAAAVGDYPFTWFVANQLIAIGVSATQWVLAGVVEDLARSRDAAVPAGR
jgi:small-conductance mechanosensitive channel